MKKKDFSKVDKYIITPNSHKELESNYLNKGFKVLLDKNFKIQRYGLDFDKNLLLHLENQETIKYWQWMYMENFFLIGKEYSIVDL